MRKIVFILLTLLVLSGVLYFFYRVFFSGESGKGALQVTSIPEATVYLNNEKIGVTPLCICGSDIGENTRGIASLGMLFGKDVGDNLLPTGEYTIRLVPNNSNFSEFQEKIIIGKNVMTVVDRTFSDGAKSEGSVISLEKLHSDEKAELLVLTIPDNASVVLDGERVGDSPLHKTDITDSNHELLISKNGYTDKAVRLKTASGYKLVAKIYLGVNEQALGSPEAATGSAQLDNEVASLMVKILPTGTGFLRVREGPSTSDQEIGRVTPGETYVLLDEEDNWFEIEFEEGETGWVSSDFAEEIGEEN